MNCQLARQALMIDPQRVPVTASEHIAACDECRRYQTTVLQLDTQAVRSIKQPTRENLTQRVMAAQRLRAARSRIVYAIAASVIAMAFMLALWFPKPPVEADWGMVMAEHMEEDPLHEEPSDPNAVERLQRVMAEVGVTKQGGMPRVVGARVCPIGKHVAVHVVFEVNGERVVAFMVPKGMGNEVLQHKEWRGELVAVNGGTVGVFAHSVAARQAVMAALKEGVNWPGRLA